MVRYTLNRLVAIGLILWVTSLVVFAATEVLPGDVVNAILGRRAEGPAAEMVRQQLNLDQPAVSRYLDWLQDIMTGQLGDSLTLNVPVGALVMERLSHSMALAVVPVLVGVPLGVVLGIVAALFQRRWLDYALSSGTMLGIALPEFVIASFAIIVFSHTLGWFPAASIIDPNAGLLASVEYLVLPSLVLTLGMLAHITRMTRARMIEILDSAYIRTAVLKGLPMHVIVLRHALPPTLVTTVHVIALNIGYLLSGLVIVESVFAYPGLGRLLLQAINSQDVPLLQVIVLVNAAIYAGANLLADLLTFVLDPRIQPH